MKLSVAESMQCRMVEWLVKNEMTGMWKEAVLIRYKVLSGICLEEMNEVVQSVIHSTHCTTGV